MDVNQISSFVQTDFIQSNHYLVTQSLFFSFFFSIITNWMYEISVTVYAGSVEHPLQLSFLSIKLTCNGDRFAHFNFELTEARVESVFSCVHIANYTQKERKSQLMYCHYFANC